MRAKLLGALLSALSTAINRLPATNLTRLPRVADFARWVAAAEPVMGLATPILDTYDTSSLAIPSGSH
jgi:hypothetical protein